jgi:hemolysin activation/secretion protein
VNWQITPDVMPASQQFILGGRQTLRGYRQNLRSADNGVSLSVEDQITLKRNAAGESMVQLIPFVDLGKVWNDRDNPTPLPKESFLAAVGLGMNWKPVPNLNFRLDYGLPLVKTNDRGSNVQDASLYFSASYRF